MIKQISQSSVNSTAPRSNQRQPQFNGLMDGAASLIQLCEKSPMINVAVLDLATAIVPRTVVESETNPYAGFEAFRRESSGLIINCMIPGVIVAGIAKLIQGYFMGSGSKMSNCWANGDTIDLVTKHWQEAKDDAVIRDGKTIYAKGSQEAKAYNTIKKILENTEGIDGSELKSFKEHDFHDSIKTLTDKAFVKEYKKADRKAIKEAYQSIVGKTHIAENIKIGGAKDYFSQNLESVVGSTPRILREIINGKVSDLGSFASKAKHLLNAKSLLGLGVIIPLALSAQPINRWITAKTSGKKGAPIYKDFEETQSRELSPKEKSALFRQKLISVSSMIGVALLSIGKFPSKAMAKSISQFKGIFPSMDQARLISTATFASRMMASEDKNDLREATVRDIATFSAFYFLGEHVSKAIASGLQKRTGVTLINNLSKAPDRDASLFKKAVHWIKDTAIKSSDELVGKRAKNLRSYCQLGNLGFSLIALGVLIPMMNRKKTNKKRKEELAKMGIDQKTIEKYYPNFMMENQNLDMRNKAYEAFFTSK